MQQVRRSAERGLANHGWLKSYHTFSFADYYDPRWMGFGPLRVINEDRIAPGTGFGTHGHRDMEIISYVLEGALGHKDNMGNTSVIRPGDVQRMSAGTGVMHSEFNHEKAGETHFLQIWIQPDRNGTAPGYEEKHFSAEQKRGRLLLVGSRDGREGSIRIQQDVNLYGGLIDGAEQTELQFAEGRKVYLHVARGSVMANGEQLQTGDALMLEGQAGLTLKQGKDAEVLLFDLPA